MIAQGRKSDAMQSQVQQLLAGLTQSRQSQATPPQQSVAAQWRSLVASAQRSGSSQQASTPAWADATGGPGTATGALTRLSQPAALPPITASEVQAPSAAVRVSSRSFLSSTAASPAGAKQAAEAGRQPPQQTVRNLPQVAPPMCQPQADIQMAEQHEQHHEELPEERQDASLPGMPPVAMLREEQQATLPALAAVAAEEAASQGCTAGLLATEVLSPSKATALPGVGGPSGPVAVHGGEAGLEAAQAPMPSKLTTSRDVGGLSCLLPSHSAAAEGPPAKPSSRDSISIDIVGLSPQHLSQPAPAEAPAGGSNVSFSFERGRLGRAAAAPPAAEGPPAKPSSKDSFSVDILGPGSPIASQLAPADAPAVSPTNAAAASPAQTAPEAFPEDAVSAPLAGQPSTCITRKRKAAALAEAREFALVPPIKPDLAIGCDDASSPPLTAADAGNAATAARMQSDKGPAKGHQAIHASSAQGQGKLEEAEQSAAAAPLKRARHGASGKNARLRKELRLMDADASSMQMLRGSDQGSSHVATTRQRAQASRPVRELRSRQVPVRGNPPATGSPGANRLQAERVALSTKNAAASKQRGPARRGSAALDAAHGTVVKKAQRKSKQGMQPGTIGEEPAPSAGHPVAMQLNDCPDAAQPSASPEHITQQPQQAQRKRGSKELQGLLDAATDIPSKQVNDTPLHLQAQGRRRALGTLRTPAAKAPTSLRKGKPKRPPMPKPAVMRGFKELKALFEDAAFTTRSASLLEPEQAPEPQPVSTARRSGRSAAGGASSAVQGPVTAPKPQGSSADRGIASSGGMITPLDTSAARMRTRRAQQRAAVQRQPVAQRRGHGHGRKHGQGQKLPPSPTPKPRRPVSVSTPHARQAAQAQAAGTPAAVREPLGGTKRLTCSRAQPISGLLVSGHGHRMDGSASASACGKAKKQTRRAALARAPLGRKLTARRSTAKPLRKRSAGEALGGPCTSSGAGAPCSALKEEASMPDAQQEDGSTSRRSKRAAAGANLQQVLQRVKHSGLLPGTRLIQRSSKAKSGDQVMHSARQRLGTAAGKRGAVQKSAASRPESVSQRPMREAALGVRRLLDVQKLPFAAAEALARKIQPTPSDAPWAQKRARTDRHLGSVQRQRPSAALWHKSAEAGEHAADVYKKPVSPVLQPVWWIPPLQSMQPEARQAGALTALPEPRVAQPLPRSPGAARLMYAGMLQGTAMMEAPRAVWPPGQPSAGHLQQGPSMQAAQPRLPKTPLQRAKEAQKPTLGSQIRQGPQIAHSSHVPKSVPKPSKATGSGPPGRKPGPLLSSAKHSPGGPLGSSSPQRLVPPAQAASPREQASPLAQIKHSGFHIRSAFNACLQHSHTADQYNVALCILLGLDCKGVA